MDIFSLIVRKYRDFFGIWGKSLFPWLMIYGIALLLLMKILAFNGLYGQDAFNYVRLSAAYKDLLEGEAYQPSGPGDLEFAVGYPFLAALLQKMGVPVLSSLLLLSILGTLLSLYYFEQILRLLSPGTRWQSRQLYSVLILGFSPVFVRSGITVMSDAAGLGLVSMAFFHGLRYWEQLRFRDLCICALGAGLAVLTRFALAALLLPFLLGLFYASRKRWFYILVAYSLGLLCLGLHFWVNSKAVSTPLSHSLFRNWSLWHFFSRHFESASGQASYLFPNLAYALFGFCHFAYFLLLPLLFLLVKRTDFAHSEQKAMAISLGVYLLFLAGIPHQNIRYLLPAYFMILVLMFPAWDRMFAYGFYFLKKRNMLLIMVFSGLVLLGGNYKIIKPLIDRNGLEKYLSQQVKRYAPPGSVLYGFDTDVALRYYLPEYQHHNLWEREYSHFSPGDYVLFNEGKFQKQWGEARLFQNWTNFKTQSGAVQVADLGDGWGLWQMRARNE